VPGLIGCAGPGLLATELDVGPVLGSKLTKANLTVRHGSLHLAPMLNHQPEGGPHRTEGLLGIASR